MLQDLSLILLENFWLIFLIILLMIREETYWAAIIIAADLAIRLAPPSNWFIILIIVTIFISDFLSPRKYWKKHYEKQINKLQKKYNKYERIKTNKECIFDFEVEDLDDGS